MPTLRRHTKWQTSSRKMRKTSVCLPKCRRKLRPKHDRTSIQKTPAINSRFLKVAAQYSVDTFFINQIMVLRLYICTENRHLRKARNHYQTR